MPALSTLFPWQQCVTKHCLCTANFCLLLYLSSRSDCHSGTNREPLFHKVLLVGIPSQRQNCSPQHANYGNAKYISFASESVFLRQCNNGNSVELHLERTGVYCKFSLKEYCTSFQWGKWSTILRSWIHVYWRKTKNNANCYFKPKALESVCWMRLT